ncbi:MAG: hypothetical protein KA508_03310 [Gammaproteobacteria bacterium]|nr:hypothetical protein [Gammaproteobacteria bacterium]
MEKLPLSATNPYLQNPQLREKMLAVSVRTSTDIEKVSSQNHPSKHASTAASSLKRDSD